MAKTTLPPDPVRPQDPRATTVPLSAITIAWPYRSPWKDDAETRTITGAQLAQFLNLIIWRLDKDATLRDAGVHGVSCRLEALAHQAYSVHAALVEAAKPVAAMDSPTTDGAAPTELPPGVVPLRRPDGA